MNRKITVQRIVSNKIQCCHCGDILESTWTHDVKLCSCKTVAVDGGLEYLHRSFKQKGDYIELSETYWEEIDWDLPKAYDMNEK